MIDFYGNGRPTPLSDLIRLYLLKNRGGSSSVLKTVTGTLLHILDALAKPAVSFEVGIEPLQSGSGDPSPDNVRPITGWTGVDVTRTGKNLLNLVESEMITSGWNRLFPISVKEGTYIISCQNQFGKSSSLGARVKFADENNTTVKEVTPNYQFGDTAFTGTATTINAEEAKRIKRLLFELRAADTTYSEIAQGNIQLEFSSTASTYEAYQGTTIPITFPDSAGTVYGCTLTLEDGEWKLRVTEAILSNALLTDANTSYDFSTSRAILAESVAKLPSNSSTDYVDPKIKATALKTTSQTAIAAPGSTTVGVARYWATRLAFGINGLGITSVSEFKTWLADNGSDVVYPLATPIEYTLSESQALTLLKGENNIWSSVTNGELSLTYKASAS